MTADPISVMPETLLSRAASTMVRNKINCLPVVDNANIVCGIVTSTDILTCYQKTLEALESLQKRLIIIRTATDFTYLLP